MHSGSPETLAVTATASAQRAAASRLRGCSAHACTHLCSRTCPSHRPTARICLKRPLRLSCQPSMHFTQANGADPSPAREQAIQVYTLWPPRHRRRHVSCAGTDVPVLRMTASAESIPTGRGTCASHVYTHACAHLCRHACPLHRRTAVQDLRPTTARDIRSTAARDLRPTAARDIRPMAARDLRPTAPIRVQRGSASMRSRRRLHLPTQDPTCRLPGGLGATWTPP